MFSSVEAFAAVSGITEHGVRGLLLVTLDSKTRTVMKFLWVLWYVYPNITRSAVDSFCHCW